MTIEKTKVLIVEDETIVAHGIETSLVDLGYEVVGKATTSSSAIDLMRECHPNIVLMDIMLEGEMDGIQAAEVITSQFNIPIIFLTAYSDKATLDRAKLTDPFGYITKPFEDRDLSTSIELALYKHQQTKILNENRDWLDSTLKSIGDPVIATDMDGKITFMNSMAQSITGWNMDEAIGRSIQEVFKLVDKTTSEPVECPVSKAIKSGVTVNLENNILLVRKDGSTVPVEDCVSPIMEFRKTLGAVLVFQNQSQLEKKYIWTKKSMEELRRSNRELAAFAATASHDLQEPLRKVIAFSNRLKEALPDLDEQQKDYLNRMQNATQRMQKFTADLLEYAQVNDSKKRNFEKVNLNSIISDVLSNMEVKIENTGTRVFVDNLPVIDADRFRIGQLFQNLIDNGIKFHKKDCPPLIHIKCRSLADDNWEVSVQDKGIGFDMEHLARVFQPFERLQGHSAFEGNGIGLAICKAIVENHQGTLTAISKLGEGSTFIITLPEKQKLTTKIQR